MTASTTKLKKYLLLALVILVSSMFFPGLYHIDNKYSTDSTQAADGILFLSEKDISDDPVRFLWHGWEYYPGRLLEPGNIDLPQVDTPPLYKQFVSIGEKMTLALPGEDSPYGCGTYRMTFYLPERAGGYALEIPEIFSAYRLYMNNQLIVQMGCPDSDHYIPRTRERLISLDGGAPVTLTLAVSNYSHFYGGLIYPPAFGTLEAVTSFQGLRLALRVFVNSIALLTAGLSMYFGLRTKPKWAFLFGALCLTMLGFTSYGILHSLTEVSIFPWYALEMFCGYLATWLMTVLFNQACRVSRTCARISSSVTGGFALLAFVYGLCSSHLTMGLIQGFSWLVFIYKIGVALYLLLAAFFCMFQKEEDGTPIFYASVFYACAFLWDRILPDFEPIFTGWFSEWGCLCLTASIGYTLWRDVVHGYESSLIFKEEHRQVSRQLAMQLTYTRQIAAQTEENRRLIHDIRHHLRVIDSMAHDSGQSAICSYLRTISANITAPRTTSRQAFCENAAINALLEYYDDLAAQNGIQLTIRFAPPDRLPLTDVELCAILGNLLENAAEACTRLSSGDRKIGLSGEQRGNTFYFLVENTFASFETPSSVFPPLSRTNGYKGSGIGLKSVEKTVTEHNGKMFVSEKNHVFQVGIILPL